MNRRHSVSTTTGWTEAPAPTTVVAFTAAEVDLPMELKDWRMSLVLSFPVPAVLELCSCILSLSASRVVSSMTLETKVESPVEACLHWCMPPQRMHWVGRLTLLQATARCMMKKLACAVLHEMKERNAT